MQDIEKLKAEIDRVLVKLNYAQQGNPSTLYEPIDYILSLGAKRFRPLLALLSYSLFRDNIDEVIMPAIGIEVFHNFTLVHDDIMDKASLRRGHQTVHTKWDTNTAILSGDAMMIQAYKLMSKAPKESFFDLMQTV